jgi:hypothetical protein
VAGAAVPGDIVRTDRPGAHEQLDVVGREATVRAGLAARSAEVGGVCYRERRRLSDDGQALVSDWTVVRDGARQDFQVRLRLYSAPELRDLLRSAGFAEVTLAGALRLDGKSPYDEAATRLVAVAYAAPGAARIERSEP